MSKVNYSTPSKWWIPVRDEQGAKLSLHVLQSIPIRSTWINDYDSCPRKALLRHRAELQVKNYRSPLEVGDMTHRILAALGCGHPIGEVEKRSINILLDEERRLFDMTHGGYFADGKSYDDVQSDLQKDFAMAKAIAFWAWKHDTIDFTRFKPEQVEGVLTANVLIGKRERTVVVQPDVIYRDTAGKVWWPDYKTTGRNVQNLVATMEWDPQRILTAVVIAALLGKHKVGGSIHVFIQRPTIRLKRDESFEEYMDRVNKWYAEEQPDEFKRVVRLKESIDGSVIDSPEFQAKLKDVADATTRRPNLAKWPRRRAACFGMFESLCEYHRLCSTPAITWHAKTMSHYEVRGRRTEEQSWRWWREAGMDEEPANCEKGSVIQ